MLKTRKVWTKSLKRRFLLLGLINGLLIFGSVLFLANAIDRQNNDALLVNLAGRQRMLSQRMAKACFGMSSGYLDDAEKANMLEILLESRHLYDETLNMFIEGGETELSANRVSTPPIIIHQEKLVSLKEMWTECQQYLDIIIKRANDQSYNIIEYQNAVHFIVEKNEIFLWRTDEIVTLFQGDAERHIMQTKQIMFLIVLFEFGIIVFYIRSINIGILAPFKRLFTALETIGSGKPYRKADKEIYDEWIQTECHINAMNDNLTSAKEALSALNRELEEKVVARTAELNNTLNQLEVTYKQLYETEKQASLGALVAGVAHEINTPIGVCVTGSTQLMDENLHLMDKIKNGQMTKNDLIDYLEVNSDLNKIILYNINRAAEVIRSFKKVAIHQSTAIIESFYLDEYLNDIWVSLSHVAKKYKSTFDNHMVHHLINGDPGDYSQIFTNLLINTFTHAYEVGDEVRINVTSSIEDDVLEIHYIDYGKGISAEHIHKIFDPFYTTNRAGGGSGLGLNILYQLVTNKLKGEVKCNSEVGRFTEFIIRVKLSKEVDLYAPNGSK